MKKNRCIICKNSESLQLIKWKNFNVIECHKCHLNFCEIMEIKEGNSSPVNQAGINMMAKSFFETKKLAHDYAEKRLHIYNNLLERKCENILDIGCGPAVFYKPYQKLNIKWTGIEVSPYWIEFGKKNSLPIHNIDIKKIKKKYDVITAHQVLEHVEDPNKFLNDIYKILRPGGILHLELPNNLSLTSTLRKISPTIFYDYGFIQPPMHMRAYSFKTIETLFKIHFLQTKNIFSCSNNHSIWGQVRNYSNFQKFFYGLTGFFGKGSLLVGIAKK